MMIPVNPEILVWARETAGLSHAEAAKAIGLGSARGISGAERLLSLEKGQSTPTRSQLVKMAEKYRRPLLTFYLESPPRKGECGEDFRTLSCPAFPAEESRLDALIRNLRVRQSLVKSLLEDYESPPLPFIGSAVMEEGAAKLAEKIRVHIGFQLPLYRAQSTVLEAFAYLRACIEGCGILVLLVSNLGSHHTTISVDTFRGIALADPIAPLLAINNQDAKQAWPFTLLHETAHLWLGSTGISGFPFEKRIEKFCNDVASEIVLPAGELARFDFLSLSSPTAFLQFLTPFANERHLSRAMVAYRFYRLGVMTKAFWMELDNQLRREWIDQKNWEKETMRIKPGGPNYYVQHRREIGPFLLGLVDRAIQEGLLSPTKAGKILDVHPCNVFYLLQNRDMRKR